MENSGKDSLTCVVGIRRGFLKSLRAILLSCLSIAALSCGGGNPSSSAVSSPIAGNWQFTLTRHNSTEQWTFSGFLLQSGTTMSGSFVLSAGACQGVGPVTGTFDGQNLQLSVGAYGQDFSLSTTLTSDNGSVTSLSGQFSTLPGGCIGFASTGTWTAVNVPPLSGSFQGSFVASGSNGAVVNVAGTLAQGPNVGASNAALSGTINATGSTNFCSYHSNATVTGLISGTSATLMFFGPDGSQIGQIPGPASPPAAVAPDASSLTGSFVFPAISNSCSGFTGGPGGATLTFQ